MRTKLKFMVVLLLGLFLLPGCQEAAKGDFSIYLLKDEMHAIELAGKNLAELELQDTPLISAKDIVSYDAATHSIELTEEGLAHMEELFPETIWVSGVPFVVTVGDERIYAGAFWTPLSSLSFDGVVILQELGEEQRILQISLGYPGPDWFTGEDPRSDQRILAALRTAKKLKE